MRALLAKVFPKTEGGRSWSASNPCPQEITTASGTHVCKKKGEHWQHLCVDPDCGFRWAR